MDDFLVRYSAALSERLATVEGGTSALGPGAEISEAEGAVMLVQARLVAHNSERRNAPLSTYLAGKFVGAWVARGGRAEDGVAEAMAIAERLLGPLPDPNEGAAAAP